MSSCLGQSREGEGRCETCLRESWVLGGPRFRKWARGVIIPVEGESFPCWTPAPLTSQICGGRSVGHATSTYDALGCNQEPEAKGGLPDPPPGLPVPGRTVPYGGCEPVWLLGTIGAAEGNQGGWVAGKMHAGF